VHVLEGEGAAVGAPHQLHDLAHGGRLEAEDVVDEDRPVHVGGGEAVRGRVELGVALLVAQAQGVEDWR
jgi:hypothetical protein